MANIDIRNISESSLNGNELFQDSENFMIEINDHEQEAILGGCPGDNPPCNQYSCQTFSVIISPTVDGVA